MGVKSVANRRTPAVVMVDGNDDTSGGTRQSTYEGVKVFTGILTVCGVGLALAAIWMQVGERKRSHITHLMHA